MYKIKLRVKECQCFKSLAKKKYNSKRVERTAYSEVSVFTLYKHILSKVSLLLSLQVCCFFYRFQNYKRNNNLAKHKLKYYKIIWGILLNDSLYNSVTTTTVSPDLYNCQNEYKIILYHVSTKWLF